MTVAVLVLNVDQPRPHDVIARLVDVNQPQEYQKARASYFG